VKRELWAVAALALLAGLAAYLYYFAWSEPLLEGEHIESWAYGIEGQNLRDFETVERGDGRLQRMIDLINDAPLSSDRVSLAKGELLVVLYREDGLQFHLFRGGTDQVGISEGDRSYVGTLVSAELAEILEGLAAEVGAAPAG